MNPRHATGTARTTDQRARLLSQTVFDRPLVLEAGAGTGKTATLVARIVAWSLGPGWQRAAEELRAHHERRGTREPAAPDRIAARVLDGVVAITFTEAAAAEMATRIAGALADVQRGDLPKGLLPEALAAAGDEREDAGGVAARRARPPRGGHDSRVLPPPARRRTDGGGAAPELRGGPGEVRAGGGGAGDRGDGVPPGTRVARPGRALLPGGFRREPR